MRILYNLVLLFLCFFSSHLTAISGLEKAVINSKLPEDSNKGKEGNNKTKLALCRLFVM